MAEGIAGSTPPPHDAAVGTERSFLMSLCEAGQQLVMITGVYKKNVELMFMHGNSAIRYLEEVVTAPDASDKMIKWSVRYLVEKGDDRQTLRTDTEYMLTKDQT